MGRAMMPLQHSKIDNCYSRGQSEDVNPAPSSNIALVGSHVALLDHGNYVRVRSCGPVELCLLNWFIRRLKCRQGEPRVNEK